MNKACTRNVGKRSCLTKDEAQNVFTVRPVDLLSTPVNVSYKYYIHE